MKSLSVDWVIIRGLIIGVVDEVQPAELHVYANLVLKPVDKDLQVCDNTSVGNDTDSRLTNQAVFRM